MKHVHALFFLLFTGVLFPAHAQLDTLYFEDFVDNRRKWTEYKEETGCVAIRDGMMECEVRQPKGRITYTFINVELPVADTFVYEIRMVFDSLSFGGALYDLNHITNKRTQKRSLCCYDAMVAHRKGLYCYQFYNNDGHQDAYWSRRRPDLNHGPLTFRITFGGNRFYCYLNGELVDSYRQVKVRRAHALGKWGWLAKGNSKFKVDHILLLGKES